LHEKARDVPDAIGLDWTHLDAIARELEGALA
jgi:hypothetical protein